MDTKHPGAGSPHLSDEDLARFDIGEVSAFEARHIEACAQCGGRLRDMQSSYAAYRLYRDALKAPLLPPPPKPWQTLDRLIKGAQANAPVPRFRWWPVPVLAASAVLAVVIAALVLYTPGQTASARANRLLTASAKLPSSPRGLISVRAHGRTLVRPAVLSAEVAPGDDPDITRLQVAFARASYDWREPLSARAFQSWRTRLPKKRDSVTVIRTADRRDSYRVRTETDSGVLRTASLTLRSPDLHAVAGDFDFENDGRVEMAEAPPGGENALGPGMPLPRLSPRAPVTETPAGPEVTLHVLAALNQIGADVGEPVEIAHDTQHQRVVVHAAGISRERAQQIADVLKPLPRVVLEFNAPGQVVPAAGGVPRERYSASIPAPLRQQFEDRFGGAAHFQEATDRMLEAGASAVAQAHALERLARDFSPSVEAVLAAPDRELLHRLRDNHISEMQNLISRIKNDLEPLLSTQLKAPQSAAPDGAQDMSWQSAVAAIVTQARKTDDALNRLLASSYAQSSADEMLRGLVAQIAQLDAAVRLESQAPR
jgi:hypothetical protein